VHDEKIMLSRRGAKTNKQRKDARQSMSAKMLPKCDDPGPGGGQKANRML
jgi:hypothetical protein